VSSDDPVRYGTLILALGQITDADVPGDLAECGVYQGYLSKFLHEEMPNRKLHLFDTFAGFDNRGLDGASSDIRFRDTSEAQVLTRIGDVKNIAVHKGYFPETAVGLEDERFAFTMIDFDKYEPTLAALDFFYQRTSPGGFIFVHDYNNPESDWACSKALNEFLADKPENAILIPDAWGTALFRKV
jgi:O-methyltransferase